MQVILILFAAFIVIGLFSRGFTGKTRLFVFLAALIMVVYVTYSAVR